MKKIKDKILEIAAIAQECPENLQPICFEILLKHSLGLDKPTTPVLPANPAKDKDKEDGQAKPEPKSVVETAAQTQDDLALTDLHVKAKRLLEKNDLSLDHLNQLFYKEGDKILPLYDDLKTTRTSESQIRITLLQCLLNAIRTGGFETEVEAARAESTERKCYDKNNWANNYTNNAALFDFDKYSRSIKTITLSEQGKKELADIIKELQ